MSLPRRSLERRFKKDTGKTLLQGIQDVRLGKAKVWLLDSEETIQTISQRVGFGSIDRFMACFKKDTGLTAQAWREKHRDGDEI